MIPDPAPIQSIAANSDQLDILDTFPDGKWGRIQFAIMSDGNVMFTADSSDGLHCVRIPFEVLAEWVEKQSKRATGQESLAL